MSAFPQLNPSGVRFQFPISTSLEYRTACADAPGGMRYSRYLRGDGLRRWSVSYSVLTDDELALIEGFFEQMRGAHATFSFTDNEDAAHPRCRFDQDSLDITHVGPNQHAVTVRIAELP